MDRTHPLSIKELTRQIKDTLEAVFPPLWVQGEVTDLRFAASGHLYFSLKDDAARIRTVMFRREAGSLSFLPENGMSVLVLARITVYESRGDYQLIAEVMEPRGPGAIRQAMEQLRIRLEAEGLFEPGKKRPLPPFPACIGVVTSATGAAIRDILKVLRERDAPVRVLLSPAVVQGTESPASLVKALEALVIHGQADVIIFGRGGGSFEDLMPFSDEKVVRAVAACPLPVVSAVGHEIDMSLVDLVADARAATPSAAAEMVAPAREDILGQLAFLASRLRSGMVHVLRGARERTHSTGSRLVHPRHILEQGRLRVDDLSFRMLSHVRSRLRQDRADIVRLWSLLRSLGPLAVLDRGYALVQKKDGAVVRTPEQVDVGEGLDVRLSEGRIGVAVREKGQ